MNRDSLDRESLDRLMWNSATQFKGVSMHSKKRGKELQKLHSC